MKFADRDFGMDPRNWETAQFGFTGEWVIAMQVNKGDMTAWAYITVWEGR